MSNNENITLVSAIAAGTAGSVAVLTAGCRALAVVPSKYRPLAITVGAVASGFVGSATAITVKEALDKRNETTVDEHFENVKHIVE